MFTVEWFMINSKSNLSHLVLKFLCKVLMSVSCSGGGASVTISIPYRETFKSQTSSTVRNLLFKNCTGCFGRTIQETQFFAYNTMHKFIVYYCKAHIHRKTCPFTTCNSQHAHISINWEHDYTLYLLYMPISLT